MSLTLYLWLWTTEKQTNTLPLQSSQWWLKLRPEGWAGTTHSMYPDPTFIFRITFVRIRWGRNGIKCVGMFLLKMACGYWVNSRIFKGMQLSSLEERASVWNQLNHKYKDTGLEISMTFIIMPLCPLGPGLGSWNELTEGKIQRRWLQRLVWSLAHLQVKVRTA